MQTINNPQMIDEVRPLTSKMPMLNRIVPTVRTRSFFMTTIFHQQLLFSILRRLCIKLLLAAR
jgi:hypothetical protein